MDTEDTGLHGNDCFMFIHDCSILTQSEHFSQEMQETDALAEIHYKSSLP